MKQETKDRSDPAHTKRTKKSEFVDASDQSDFSDDEYDEDFIDDDVEEEDESFYRQVDIEIVPVQDISDYRKNPYISPNLDDKKKREVDEKFQLLCRKGVYPYEYMDCFERFKETQLTPYEKFYSTLSVEHISETDYQHTNEVWNVFNCQNLEDYHDIYLLIDIYCCLTLSIHL